jgi:hypothetical protein
MALYHEITEPDTRRVTVGVWFAKDGPHTRDNGRHLIVAGCENARGTPEDIVLIYPDTTEQRERAQAIKEQLLPHPWPRLGSRERVRATVRVVERVVEACGWQLPEHERRILDRLRALA